MARIHREERRVEAVRTAAELDAETVACPRYFNASRFERLTSVRHLAGCAKFED